jgi:hypothetical protein
MLYLPTSSPPPRTSSSQRPSGGSSSKRLLLLLAPIVPLLFAIGCEEGQFGRGGSPYQGGGAAEPAPVAPTTGPSGAAPAPTTNPAPTGQPGGQQPGGQIDPTPIPGGGQTPGTTPATMTPAVTPAPGTPVTNPAPMGPAPVMTPAPVNPVTRPIPQPPVSEIEFPKGVRDILERRCISCHTYGERDPIGWGSALDLSRMVASDIVVPGDPDKSRLMNRVAVRADMPFNGARLSSDEVQVLRSWIGNLNRPNQKPRSNDILLDIIATDPVVASADTRYISFANFVDEHRSPEELTQAVRALGIALNSLSKKATIFRPEAVDTDKTIYRFKLSQLGWNRDDWDELISFYPYCERSDKANHRTVYNKLQTESPYVRGDWFLATATKPPLYEKLLDIPDTLQQLENDLRIDIADNINRGKVQRIGFRSSGVSAHNRMIERHVLPNSGYFWISYDFAGDIDDQDLRANPLGPKNLNLEGNFNRQFQHAGGEAIWSLPNGMQAYMLLNSAGTRLDLAPKEIVKDPRRQGGAVENGISCIGCHGVTGMLKPRIFDEITAYAEVNKRDFSRAELDEIKRLYVPNGVDILQNDADRYLKAMEAAGGLRPEQGTVEYDGWINLVGQYEGKVGLRAASTELGLDVATTRTFIAKENARGRTADTLPLELSDPLVTRNDFVCRFRNLAPNIAPNTAQRVQFCAGTFTDQNLRNLCD